MCRFIFSISNISLFSFGLLSASIPDDLNNGALFQKIAESGIAISILSIVLWLLYKLYVKERDKNNELIEKSFNAIDKIGDAVKENNNKIDNIIDEFKKMQNNVYRQ